VSRRRTNALAEASRASKTKVGRGATPGGSGPPVGAADHGRSIVDEHAAFDRAFAVDRVQARAEVKETSSCPNMPVPLVVQHVSVDMWEGCEAGSVCGGWGWVGGAITLPPPPHCPGVDTLFCIVPTLCCTGAVLHVV
jgi:hypothetical protein